MADNNLPELHQKSGGLSKVGGLLHRLNFRKVQAEQQLNEIRAEAELTIRTAEEEYQDANDTYHAILDIFEAFDEAMGDLDQQASNLKGQITKAQTKIKERRAIVMELLKEHQE